MLVASLLGAAGLVFLGLSYGKDWSLGSEHSQVGSHPTATEAVTHTVTGTLIVQTVHEDYACGSVDNLKRLRQLIAGKTFPCPEGPGGGYSDIADGATVTVKDESGKTLAIGRLANGLEGSGGVGFTFKVEDVPEAKFYEIEVSDRGGLTYTLQEMEDHDWKVDFTLGNY